MESVRDLQKSHTEKKNAFQPAGVEKQSNENHND